VEPAGGKIHVKLTRTTLSEGDLHDNILKPGPYAQLSIVDTGCGIQPHLMNKIFDPYFTTKAQGKGTGLGLAVVHGIVKDHRGDITVYSEPGKGTVFHVFLPILKDEETIDEFEKLEDLEKGTEHILLVDDEKAVLSLQQNMLQRLGYRITACTNSLAALETFRDNPDAFDLVITDMTMPHMTGDQLASHMFSIKPGVPVIICTGFSERIDRNKAVAMGIRGFMMKPVVKSEMAGMIRKALEPPGEGMN